MKYAVSVFIVGQKEPALIVDTQTYEQALEMVNAISNGEAFQGTHETCTFIEPKHVTHYRITQVLNDQERLVARDKVTNVYNFPLDASR